MELDEIKEFMQLMEAHGMTKLAVKRADGSEIQLEKTLPPVKASELLYSNLAMTAAPLPGNLPQEEEVNYITSPMVGTFYAAASPDTPSYVNVGDHVTEDTVVCIIEAMKVMNEVKAGQRGVIKKGLVDTGHPVEYGTRLFEIQ
ncbi:MAG: acetyl-CoA carboxylase biotin carboxyl carrier protein [Simkaniaceae bacterium]|nr:acetyl-CoA carboxylase biotin carboxyl carrier protein [Simkaniaceae bacterium]